MGKDNPEVMKRRVNKWRENNREKSRELDRASYERNKEKRKANKKRYYAENKNKNKAQNKVNYQWKKKNIKTNSCLECGSQDNLIKHHPDYSKPLEVVVLCKLCHNRLHKSVKETVSGARMTRPDIHAPDRDSVKATNLPRKALDGDILARIKNIKQLIQIYHEDGVEVAAREHTKKLEGMSEAFDAVEKVIKELNYSRGCIACQSHRNVLREELTRMQEELKK